MSSWLSISKLSSNNKNRQFSCRSANKFFYTYNLSWLRPTKIGTGISMRCVKLFGKLNTSGWCHLNGLSSEWNNSIVDESKAELLDTNTILYSSKSERNMRTNSSFSKLESTKLQPHSASMCFADSLLGTLYMKRSPLKFNSKLDDNLGSAIFFKASNTSLHSLFKNLTK